MSERYEQRDGQIYDKRSKTFIPFDIYWIVDLLNLKENHIKDLEDELDDD